MNLLADESVDYAIVERLRRNGYEVLYISEMEPGIPDEQVLARANENDALLLTADKDFGEMTFRQRLLANGGVVLIRLAGSASQEKADRIGEVFATQAAEFREAFSVITADTIRIRTYKSLSLVPDPEVSE